MLVAVARFDPAEKPPGQFTVANIQPKSKYNEIFIQDDGHFDYPGNAEQRAVLRDRIRQFCKVP